jgi:hypothetical protein
MASKPISFTSPNYNNGTVADQLEQNQPPLGSQFKSYELNQATNYYLLDPFQYSITKFDYNFPDGRKNKSEEFTDFKNDPGLIYKDVDFERLLSLYTSTKKSVNDFPAQSYHRFEANDGYFNPKESVDNTDLWYYGSDRVAKKNGIGIAGPPLNVQEIKHIVFPEPQRGGTNSRQLTKYSWSNTTPKQSVSWESKNSKPVNNNQNCEFFNYNTRYTVDKNKEPYNKVYSFDSEYCRSIGINDQYNGSMPFNPRSVN